MAPARKRRGNLRRAQTAITKLRIQHKFLRFFASATAAALEATRSWICRRRRTHARRIPSVRTLSLAPFYH